MSVIEKTTLAVVILFLAVACFRLFSSPLKLVLRLGVNTGLGFLAVWLLNLSTSVTGLSLSMSLFNALTIAVLGVPGFFLLLLLQWVLT